MSDAGASRFSLADCRWVPWAIAAAFLVVIAANGALAFFALRSDTGLVARHPYELGNGYNRVLDEGAAADALGWQGRARFEPAAPLAGRLVVELRGGDGAPLADLAVSALLVRPVEPLPTAALALDADAPGRYAAPLALARAGQWEVRVTATRGAEVYRFAQRFVVP